MHGWYYVASLTGQRHDRVQTESQIATVDSCLDLVGSLQHGVASCEVFSWSTDIHKTHYMQMVMTSDETQIQVFANWPMSHAKRVTRDNRNLRWFPSKRSDETWYVDVTRQGDVKNVIKSGGHRACFHATMLTNTVITVTFGDLRAQLISAIIFQCGVISHRVRLSLIVYSSMSQKNGFKYLALLINIFIL